MKRGLSIAASMLVALAGVASAPQAAAKEAAAKEAATSGANAATPLRVAILGDRTGLARPGVFETAVDRVRQMRPDLVVMVGDLIEGYSSDPAEIKREWSEADAMLAGLEAPFVLVPGNHDISNDAMAAAWRKRRGAPWSSFVRGDILFLALNSDDPPMPMPPAMETGFRQMAKRMLTDPAGAVAAIAAAPPPSAADIAALKRVEQARIGAEQIAYVRRALAANPDVKWTVVLIHKPAWHDPASGFDKIEALLADRSYLVIAGHMHRYSHEKRLGRDYIIMGPTGAVPPHDAPNEKDRIGWLTLGAGDPAFLTIDLEGISGLDGPQPARAPSHEH